MNAAPLAIDLSQPINWAHPLNAGLIHWWRALPNLSGSLQLFDLVGPALGLAPGTISGAAWSYDDRYNPTLFYDGTNDSVAFGDLNNVEGITVMSITAWVNSNTLAGGTSGLRYIVSKEDGGGAIWVLRQLTGGDKLQWFANDGTLRGPQEVNGFAANQWFHVCATYQSGAGLDLYLNGAASTGTGFSAIGTLSTGTQPVEIGGPIFSAGRAWSGWIQDVRIVGQRYTQADAYALYRQALLNNPTLLNHVGTAKYFFSLGSPPVPIVGATVILVDQEFIGDNPYELATELFAAAATGGDIPSGGGSGDLDTANGVNVLQQLLTTLTIPILTQNVTAVSQTVQLTEQAIFDNEVAVGSNCNLFLSDSPNELVGNRYRR